MLAARFALALALAALLAAGAARAQSAKLAAVGTEFRLTLPDGRVLGSCALIGAIVTLETAQGAFDLRIDGVESDPRDAAGARLGALLFNRSRP